MIDRQQREIENRLIQALSDDEVIDLAAALGALVYVTAAVIQKTSLDHAEVVTDFSEALAALVATKVRLQ